MDINKIAKEAREAVVEVGDFVAKSQSHILSIKQKSVRNPQTDVDVKAEKMLRDKLHSIFPEAGFILEEAESIKSDEYNWAIDAIDGTKFYSTQFPAYFTQIALMHKDKPIIAAIYCPVAKQLFHAISGKGAFLNDTLLKISYDGPLSQSLVSLEIGKVGDSVPHSRLVTRLMSKTHRLMIMGGILAPYLTTNTIQAYINYYNGLSHQYDLAPRWLIHEEAGACVHKHMYEGHNLYISAHPKLLIEIEGVLDINQ